MENLLCDNTKSLYRFQGGSSYTHFKLTDQEASFSLNKYVYFSKNFDHHRYFVYKRLKQIINKISLETNGISISRCKLAELDYYHKLRKAIVNFPNITNLESIRFFVDFNLIALIEDNYIYNESKLECKRVIERVDRKVYGGGYGIADEWLELFNYLTFAYSKKEISRSDLIKLLNDIKSGYKSNLDCVSFISKDITNLTINSSIYSSFNKYEIARKIEEIMDKKLYREGSFLSTNPKLLIKKINNDYLSVRDKILFLDDNARKK